MTTTPSTAPETVDVLVVGAGPTGLLLAGISRPRPSPSRSWSAARTGRAT